jgi:hypothetical protein
MESWDASSRVGWTNWRTAVGLSPSQEEHARFRPAEVDPTPDPSEASPVEQGVGWLVGLIGAGLVVGLPALLADGASLALQTTLAQAGLELASGAAARYGLHVGRGRRAR